LIFVFEAPLPLFYETQPSERNQLQKRLIHIILHLPGKYISREKSFFFYKLSAKIAKQGIQKMIYIKDFKYKRMYFVIYDTSNSAFKDVVFVSLPPIVCEL